MTDEQWEAQNGRLTPDQARAAGLCWCCCGNGVLYSAFAGEQIVVGCPERCNNGRPR